MYLIKKKNVYRAYGRNYNEDDNKLNNYKIRQEHRGFQYFLQLENDY